MRTLVLLASTALLAATAHADTQRWNYKSYPRDKLSGQYLKDKFMLATVEVEEQDGQARFLMTTPGRGDPCISNVRLPAEIEREDGVLVLTVKPTLAGCEPFRYRIRTDGSGGVRQHLRDGTWRSDGLDHDLTPKP